MCSKLDGWPYEQASPHHGEYCAYHHEIWAYLLAQVSVARPTTTEAIRDVDGAQDELEGKRASPRGTDIPPTTAPVVLAHRLPRTCAPALSTLDRSDSAACILCVVVSGAVAWIWASTYHGVSAEAVVGRGARPVATPCTCDTTHRQPTSTT